MKLKILVVFLVLIAELTFVQLVSADGMLPPVIKKIDIYSIEENGQYAVVEVFNESYEMIHLFLSLSHMGLEETNITLLIPLISEPSYLRVVNTTSRKFLKGYKYEKIKLAQEKQSVSGLLKQSLPSTKELFGEYMYLTFFERTGLVGAIFTGPRFGSIQEQVKSIEKLKTIAFESGVLEVYRVEKGETLEEFLRKNYPGVEIPDKLREVVDKYGRHYVVVLTLEVEGMDNESRKYYGALKSSNPELLSKVVEFVKKESIIELNYRIPRCYYSYKLHVCDINCYRKFPKTPDCPDCEFKRIDCAINCSYTSDEYIMNLSQKYGIRIPEECTPEFGIKSALKSEFVEFAKEYTNSPELDTAVNLIYSLYKTMRKGLQMDIGLPIDGKVYYPLGTGAAWYTPITDTRIIVKMDDDLEAEFEHDSSYSVLLDGLRYYVWEIENANPDFDITGTIKNASTFTKINDRFKLKIADWYAKGYYSRIGAVIFAAFFAIIIVLLSLFDAKYFTRKPVGDTLTRGRIRRNVIFYAILAILTPLLSIYIAGIVTLVAGIFISRDRKYYVKRVLLFAAVVLILFEGLATIL